MGQGNSTGKDNADNNNDVAIPPRSNRQPAYNEPTHRIPDEVNTNNTDVAINEVINENVVPTVFKWEHGGRHVYITGTFNNWERQIPMHRSGNDFTYVHNLKKGKHAFKYIVDDEWRFAPDQPTIADIEGRINNFIDVSDFVPYVGDDSFFDKSKEQNIYWLGICILDEYQGKGFGNQMMIKLIEIFKEKQLSKELYLTVDKDNQKAINLYKKFNFDLIEDNNTYYKMKLLI
jgi:ribosomal protein S18 acetylase RimI-like enzyme